MSAVGSFDDLRAEACVCDGAEPWGLVYSGLVKNGAALEGEGDDAAPDESAGGVVEDAAGDGGGAVVAN